MATRPSRDEMLLEIASVVAKRSTCSRASVGAVISRDGRILVTGYNGAPAGMRHCQHRNNEPCTVAVHAECNAIAWAARHGVRLEGAELHSSFTPCLPCAQLIVNAGIVRVSAISAYREVAGWRLLQEAGVETVHA